jgi:voltage-gated sodium channel
VGWQGLEVLPPGTQEGVNLGRKYCFALDFPIDFHEAEKDSGIKGIDKYFTNGQIKSCSNFVKFVNALAHQATKRHQSKSLRAMFARSRLAVRALFQWLPFQLMVGVLLVLNFAMELYKSQTRDEVVTGDPSLKFMARGDLAFLIIFSLELSLNLYAHWMKDFVSDGWCCFDFIVVSMSIMTPFLSDAPVPISIIRLFRAFRILRIFGRLKSIRSIINALTTSIIPVGNAFFIMFIVMMLYAILGCSLFSDIAPDSFSRFDRAMAALFRIAAGDTWVEGVDVLTESGAVHWAVGIYVFSFTLVVNWTLLQVSDHV